MAKKSNTKMRIFTSFPFKDVCDSKTIYIYQRENEVLMDFSKS